MEFKVEQLYQELLALDEHTRIEAKRASEIGKSIMQTVCAFANEPGLGGGFILLGVCEPDDEHKTFWVQGIEDADNILNRLQNNCRNQFEQSVAIQSQHARIEDKLVIAVFVPELYASAKPCRFLGKPDKTNKRKTGVWRRGSNGDYECTERELEPLLQAKSGRTYDQTPILDADWGDIDPSAINLYRQLRSKVKPHAEELQANDQDMLRALNLIYKDHEEWKPNVAGLLMLGKPLALRRLFPAMRVDYVRVNGTEWVEDPEQRFATTLDLREPLIKMIPRLEATILDDMPRHFRLHEGESQRSDQPLLPQKVIREAVVNAVMHRDYQVNQPILIVRYSNRLEIRNPGYSLKPELELGEMGSVLRNPHLAAVLYDIDLAETKGSGIRTMRKLLEAAGLIAPVFSSNRDSNQFTGSYLLHQLMGEEQLNWLKNFKIMQLSHDELRALVLTREIGAVDNAALRAVTGLDTLSASQLLGKLWKTHDLLEKGGKGSATYYRLSQKALSSNTGDLAPNTGDLVPNTGDLVPNTGDLTLNTGDLTALPDALQRQIDSLTTKARKQTLWPIILEICSVAPHSADRLGTILGRQAKNLKSNHLNRMRDEGFLSYQYPEVTNHPDQAYKITPKGLEWLKTSVTRPA